MGYNVRCQRKTNPKGKHNISREGKIKIKKTNKN